MPGFPSASNYSYMTVKYEVGNTYGIPDSPWDFPDPSRPVRCTYQAKADVHAVHLAQPTRQLTRNDP
jgi:hypothetical protein